MKTANVVTLVSCLLHAACGGGHDEDNSLSDAENVRLWATTASAVAVYSHAYGPIAFADGHGDYDSDCPLTADDGITVTLRGGCTDTRGNDWIGTATVVRSDDGSRELSLESFGSSSSPELRAAVTGSVSLQSLGSSEYRFVADLVHEGGMTTEISYTGTVRGTYDAPTVWNGSGRVERHGMVPPTGAVDATTADEVVDDAVCSGQPASGSTTLRRADEIAVVTYDGATDCDPEQRARWSVDGDDRGLIDGISCALAAPGSPRPGAIPTGLLLGALGLASFAVRRRSRRCRARMEQ